MKPIDESGLPRFVIMTLSDAGFGDVVRGTGPSTDPGFEVEVQIFPFDAVLAQRVQAAVPSIRLHVIPGSEQLPRRY